MGNIVSWFMIFGGFIAGYTRLQGNVNQAEKTASDAKIVSESAKEQVHGIKTDIEVIKVTTQNTEKKLDELRGLFNQRLTSKNEE